MDIVIVYLILLICTGIIGQKLYGSILNPITVWASLWSFIGMMSNLAFYRFYPPSDYVNGIIITGIISYTIFSIFYWRTRKQVFLKPTLENNVFRDDFNFKLFLWINIICLLIEAPYFIKAIRILNAHSFSMMFLRGVLTDSTEGIINGGFLSIVRDSGIKNVYTLSAIYASILLFSGSNNPHKKQIITIAIIEVLEYTVTNAARVYLVNFITYLAFAALLFKSRSILRMIYEYRRYFIVGVLLVVAALLMQQSRSDDMTIFETLYVYYVSGPSYLTNLIEDSSNTGITIGHDYYWGTMTLGFIANIYYYLKIGLLGINDSTVTLLASVITIKQYFVGENTYINAMCTCFYPFLADWGTAGAVIGPIIASFLTNKVYHRYFREFSIGSMAVCIFILNIMIRTVFKWELIYIDFSVLFIVNYFINKKTYR